MSDLSPWEKRRFEQVLGMSTGFVLDFSDRTFREFVQHSTGIDINQGRYYQGGTSKAKRLRTFWQLETNPTVGKLLGDMLEYSEDTGKRSIECRTVVERLLGKQVSSPQSAKPNETNENELREIALRQRRSQDLASLKDLFLELALEPDRNRAGLELEKLLNRLFALYDLAPAEPFRVVGEQIDGAFLLDNEVYLLESKWEKAALPEAPLLVFLGKIEAKSLYTRGVMIALNGVSSPAADAITRGKVLRFFVMNGDDVLRILGEAISLPDFLRKRMRLLAERGRMFVPFTELQ